jgi:predicted nucleotidyltransferase
VRPDVAEILRQLREFFGCHHEGLICVYLYGSMARGVAHQNSDVDLAVLYAQDPPPTLDGLGLGLGSTLERHLGRLVDLLVLNHAPVDLVHRILRDGMLVYDREPSTRVRFEVQARNAYFDLLPYLRQYRHTTRSTQT